MLDSTSYMLRTEHITITAKLLTCDKSRLCWRGFTTQIKNGITKKRDDRINTTNRNLENNSIRLLVIKIRFLNSKIMASDIVLMNDRIPSQPYNMVTGNTT